MKTKILSLIIAQIFATVLVLRSNAEIYTSLCIYGAQAVIILFFLACADVSRQKQIQKVLTIGQVIISAVFLVSLLFILSKLDGARVINPDGTSRILDIGRLSVLSLVLSSFGFIIQEVINKRTNKTVKLSSNLVNSMHFFMVSFAYIAELILIIFIAIAFSSNDMVVIMVAAIKTALDVGILKLTKELKNIDLSFGKSFKGL